MKGKLSVPVGFKFAPKPCEIMEFPACKAMGKPLPCDGFILENLDLYRVEDPGQLFEGEGAEREVVYAFIKWKKYAGKGKRFDHRVVGNSTWKSVVSSRPVYGTRKQGGKVIIGWSRTLKFHTKKKLRGNHDYIIHEFSLDDLALSHPEFKENVVCRIKRKPSKKKSSPEENWPQSHSSALPNEYHENIFSMPTFTHQNTSGCYDLTLLKNLV